MRIATLNVARDGATQYAVRQLRDQRRYVARGTPCRQSSAGLTFRPAAWPAKRRRASLIRGARRHHSNGGDSFRDARQWRRIGCAATVASNRHGDRQKRRVRSYENIEPRSVSGGPFWRWRRRGDMIMRIFLCQGSWSASVRKLTDHTSVCLRHRDR